MPVKDKILSLLKDKRDATIHEIALLTESSRQMVHRAMNDLLADQLVIKLGKPPKTYYRLKSNVSVAEGVQLDLGQEIRDFLDKHCVIITELGEKLSGIRAMDYWCQRQNLPLEKTCKEYVTTRRKYLSYYHANGLIDGMHKIRNTGFDQVSLDEVYYADFYAIERFGKTRLGILLHFAKQGQNRKLMKEIIDLTVDLTIRLVREKNIQAVGYIPPTIRREVQLMKVLEHGFGLSLPHIKLIKVTGEIAVPQKTLTKIEDRIKNANASIMVRESRRFDNVLLIDDAIGSGATINETATKLKQLGIAQSVIGLAVTGSYKGFEVIQEV